MTVLASIRYLITLDLKLKGLDASIIEPVNSILSLIDEELVDVGYDFINPQIEVEIDRLEGAISGRETDKDPAYFPTLTDSPAPDFESNFDPFAFLDDE